jgi:hypothetical protein
VIKKEQKQESKELPLLTQEETLHSLSDSIRFVNKKINGGRLRDKDITKLQWLKMQERLTDLYLKGLKDYTDRSNLL